MSYTDRFGGSTVQPANVSYRAVALATNEVTLWPPFATGDDYLARLMDVSASAPGLSITLPDAREVSVGQDVFFNGTGANTFTVLDAEGNVLATVAPGQQKYFYITDNSTEGGSWRIILFGVGASALDAAQYAGFGLRAINDTLNVAMQTSLAAGDFAIVLADLATAFKWTGGTGTITLPLITDVGTDFWFEVRNQGTGSLTLSGSENIDGSATIALQVNESCFVHAGTGEWFTVGRGRNAQFNFTQLVKSVNGGTDALTLTEAANVVQTYTGTLLSNQTIVLPAVVQVYYVSNQTGGAFNFSFESPTPGTTVSIPSGQNAVLFCDGVNVINASTTLAGLSSLVLAAGSAGAPSLGVGAVNSGLYSPGSNQVAVTTNSAQVFLFNTSGGVVTSGATTAIGGVVSAANDAATVLDRIAGKKGSILWRTAGVNRWELKADSDTEAGANAGSTLRFLAYSDAGASLGQFMSVERATGDVSFYHDVFVGNAGTALSATNADDVQSGRLCYLSGVAGTNTITATADPTVTAYVEGQTVRFIAANANTGAVTLNIDGVGAADLKLPDGTALASGALRAGGVYEAVYTGTEFRLLSMPYSQGVFNLTLAFGGASVGITYSSRFAEWVRVGNLVTVNGRLSLTSKGSSTGVATVTGLPFVASTITAASLGNLSNISYTGMLFAHTTGGGTALNLATMTEAGSPSAPTDAQFTNNSVLAFSISYVAIT